MDFSPQAWMTLGGGALVFVLTTWFKSVKWSDTQKVLFLMGASAVVAVVWFFVGQYPNFLEVLKGIFFSALAIFTFLVKLLGLDINFGRK